MPNTTPISEWKKCYDESWKGAITDASFAHPAKYSRGLIERIYAHCVEHGYLKRGNTVVDPFGGVALGGIIGACFGIKWISVELEEKFVTLGNANIALHARKWETFGDPLPRHIKGDSRKLREVLGPALAECVVGSPPFMENNVNIGAVGDTPAMRQLGNSTGETFWSAAALIVRECWEILKPRGIAVWVVKSFVRDGKIQDFPGDWRRLCEHAGFDTIEEVHASLVKEETHPDLFEGKRTTRKKRVSFFRRLHEKKRPDLAINHEVVYFMVKRCSARNADRTSQNQSSTPIQNAENTTDGNTTANNAFGRNGENITTPTKNASSAECENMPSLTPKLPIATAQSNGRNSRSKSKRRGARSTNELSKESSSSPTDAKNAESERSSTLTIIADTNTRLTFFGSAFPAITSNMEEGQRLGLVDAILSSPPYAQSLHSENGIDYSKAAATPGKDDRVGLSKKKGHPRVSHKAPTGTKPSIARDAIGSSYGDTPGNLGSMPEGTPP